MVAGMKGDGMSDMDEIHKMLSDQVAMDRDGIKAKEGQWPDEIKAEIRKVMTKACEILNPDSDDSRPIAERMIEVRSKLGVTIAALAGVSVSEMIEHELEAARLAEVVATLTSLEEIFRETEGT